MYNYLSNRVKKEIKKHKDEGWKAFLERIGPNFVSSVPFWQRVRKMRSNWSARKIPTLIKEGKVYSEDQEKASLFRDRMESRQSGLSDQKFDNDHKAKVEADVKKFIEKNSKFTFEPVTMRELKDNISRLKNKSSAGKDGIHNCMLKHLPPNCLQYVLDLSNMSLKEGKIPELWKEARLTMIPKGGGKSASDPANYRPISLLSCLGKLIERVVAQRLKRFLEAADRLAKHQSGFRPGRRTGDNLFFFTQKVTEAFNRGKKILSLYFDIEAAFDAVWHDGLIYKMIIMKVPTYIIMWVYHFLQNRNFDVRVGESISTLAKILTGVPQGSSISPILFSIFINDIPAPFRNNQCYSLLFADDLNIFFVFNKPSTVAKQANKLMKELEVWLCKWRLKMAPSKCQHTVFSKGNRNKDQFDLRLFGETIPYEANPVSLGVSFDASLSFQKQVASIKKKCVNRLNIVKILSHKSWGLTSETQVAIYRSLIGSVIDYSAFMCSQLSDSLMRTVQAIQNSAMRAIYKMNYDAHTVDLCAASNLPLVEERMMELNERYIQSSFLSSNVLFCDLAYNYRRSFFGGRLITETTLLCDFNHLLETVIKDAHKE
jgi:hypothetical protein